MHNSDSCPLFTLPVSLSDAELAKYEATRDLAAELLQSVREMKAGQVHVVLPPVISPWRQINAIRCTQE